MLRICLHHKVFVPKLDKKKLVTSRWHKPYRNIKVIDSTKAVSFHTLSLCTVVSLVTSNESTNVYDTPIKNNQRDLMFMKMIRLKSQLT